MLCEVCKKSDATVHITKIVNGIKNEFSLCNQCAREKGEFNLNGQIDSSSPFTFQNILNGIMDHVGAANQIENNFHISCSNCGITYNEFKKRGLLGCSECYSNFTSTLKPIIKRVQGNLEHTGKLPRKAGENIIKRRKVSELKEDLQKAIADEEYEKAAQIRDAIKEIQGD